MKRSYCTYDKILIENLKKEKKMAVE